MFVRLKHGPHAGEAVEMKFADAQPLLADGRAEQVYVESPGPQTPIPNNGRVVLKPVPPVPKDRKKKSAK